MALDFSSDKAWRRLKLMTKLGIGGMLVAAALAIPMNASEGRPLVPSYMFLGAPLLLALFLSPWFFRWAFLRLSESTLRTQSPTKRREEGALERTAQNRKERLRGVAMRAALLMVPVAWPIYHAASGGHDLPIVWVLSSAMAVAGAVLLGAVAFELTKRPKP